MAVLNVALVSENLEVQATFTTVMSTLAAFFATAGWVQTSDTGQINFASSINGYQIWGMNDTLQGTAPWYMKIVYKTQHFTFDGGVGVPAFTFQFGMTTDGAGNFTGSQVSQIFSFNCMTGSTVVQHCYLSGANNRFTWNLWDGPTQYEALNIGVERTKDSSGADTADGLIFFGRANGNGSLSNGASQVISQVIPASGVPGDAQPMWAAAINLAQNTMATGATIGWAYPIPFNGAPFNTGKNFLLYQGTDFPEYSIQSLPVYGTNHNFLVCTPNAYPPTQPPGLAHVLLRYE